MLKNLFVKIIDFLPPRPTMFFGALFVIMPIYPRPHLLEKALMMRNNLVLETIDWVDMGLHVAGGLLALAVYLRFRQRPRQGAEGDNS